MNIEDQQEKEIPLYSSMVYDTSKIWYTRNGRTILRSSICPNINQIIEQKMHCGYSSSVKNYIDSYTQNLYDQNEKEKKKEKQK
jgi:hypothetical protein